jgi:hypothetical protein
MGTTTSGLPFTRETTLTAAIRARRDTPPEDGHDGRELWCELLRCLSRSPKLLERLGPEADDLVKCLQAGCRQVRAADVERRRGKR